MAGGRGALAATRAVAPPRPSSEPSAAGPRPAVPAASRKEMGALAEENAQLRKEVQEVRDCLTKVMIGSEATPAASALPDSTWLAAQLMQSHRQVQLLTEALVQRGELSTELEAALNKLRQPAADGKRSEYADWATSTLRRLRHVQFVEELAAVHQPKAGTAPRSAARASGRGVGGHR